MCRTNENTTPTIAATVTLIFLFLIAPGTARGEPLTVPDNYIPAVSYLPDPDGSLDVAGAVARANEFQSWHQPAFNYGYSGATVWLRIHLRAPAAAGQHLLIAENPRLDDVRLYVETARGFTEELSGDRLPYVERSVEHRNFVFRLPADLTNIRSMYLSVRTTGPILVPLRVLTEDALHEADAAQNLFHGAYYAVMIVLFAYNLILFLSLRDLSFLYYVLFQAVIALLLATITGYADQFFWPHSVWLNQHGSILLVGLAAILGSLIATSFLSLQAKDRWVRYALRVVFLCGILGTGLALSPWLEFAHIFSQYASIVCLLCFIFAPLALGVRRGNRPARLLFFAWMLFVAGTFLFIGRNLGILPDNLWTRHGMHIGSVLEGITLSVALADRYNGMRFAALRSRLEIDRLHALDDLRSRFYANVSHEFRTPLTLILAPVERLLRETPAGENRGMLETIQRNALVLLRLFQNLLDLNRMDSGGLSPEWRRFDIVAFARRTIDHFRDAAQERGLDLEFSAAEDTVEIVGDPYLLERVLYNLLSNALRFTTQGRITVHVERAGDGVAIHVTDTGQGIAPEDLPRVFDRFYGTSGTGPGSGLGLALSREIVQLHEGSLRAESQQERGSCFTIELPARADEAAPEFQDFDRDLDELRRRRNAMLIDLPNAREEVAYIKRSKIDRRPAHHTDSEDDFQESSILLLEDNTELRNYLRETLAEHFYVTACGDGTEALARARSERPDLIVADIMTPGLDGYQLLAHCKQDAALASTPFIFLTARGDVQDRVRGLQGGADEYLAKPFQDEELIARVKAVLRGRRRAESDERRRVYAAFHDHLGGRLTDLMLLLNRRDANSDAPETLAKLREEIRSVLYEFRDFLSDEDDRASFAEDFADALHVILLRRYARAGRVLVFQSDASVTSLLRGPRREDVRSGLHTIAIELATNDLKYGGGVSQWELRRESGGLALRMHSATNYAAGTQRGHGRRNLHHTAAVLHGFVEEDNRDGVYSFTLRIPEEAVAV